MEKAGEPVVVFNVGEADVGKAGDNKDELEGGFPFS